MRREAWFQMLENSLRRLPKAVGIRVAFEADSTLGPEDAKGLYVQRSATGEFVRSELTYSPQDESTPGARWYLPLRAEGGGKWAEGRKKT